MTKTITLTETELDLLRSILSQLLDSDYKGYGKHKLSLTSDQYLALYGSGQSSRKLGKLYSVNPNHFNRVWKSMGLDVIRDAPSRIAWYERHQEATD